MTTPAPSLQCPVPMAPRDEISVAHGGGGRLTQALIDGIFRPAFGPAGGLAQHDGALLALGGGRLAFSTDAHVVTPLFFSGGDIGALSVHGTVNDLAMCGARPLWLSAAFILEEGLPIPTLQRVVDSMRRAAANVPVAIVTGDTKVVERGKADRLYIVTAGVGVVETSLTIAPGSIRPGDAILVSGDLGRHGMAIMATREGLAFESPIASDCASLSGPVQALLAAGLELHCLRDLTRGGLATALVELAEGSGLALAIEEERLPVSEPVRGACELLGLEPMYVANEGRFVVLLPEAQADTALQVLAATGAAPARVGTVRRGPAGRVTLRTLVGAERLVDRLSGEQLPRIC